MSDHTPIRWHVDDIEAMCDKTSQTAINVRDADEKIIAVIPPESEGGSWEKQQRIAAMVSLAPTMRKLLQVIVTDQLLDLREDSAAELSADIDAVEAQIREACP